MKQGRQTVTLKKKIVIGYCIVSSLMVIVVIWAIINIFSLGKASESILRENYKSILAAKNMTNAIEQQENGILLAYSGKFDQGLAKYKENEYLFIEWFQLEKANITVKGESELVDSIKIEYSKFQNEATKLFFKIRTEENNIESCKKTYEDIIQPCAAKIKTLCHRLYLLNEKTMYTSSNRADNLAQKSIWSTVLIMSTVLILVLVLSLFLAGRIVKPLKHFIEASRKMSSGNFAVKIPIETDDELGILTEEFNKMAEKLKQFLEMNIEKIISEKNKNDAILASIEDGIIVFDNDNKIIAINPSACRILNLEYENCMNKKCSEILPMPNTCDLIKRVIETGNQPNISEEKRIITLLEGETPNHYLYSITTIKGREQKLNGVVLLLRDITRIKEVEQMKTEFVMAASHELRTPLTGIGMSIDLLIEDISEKIPEKDQELLHAAHEEVKRMKALVNDLLDLSRIETGRIDLEFSNVDVKSILNNILDFFSNQVEKREVKLLIEVPSDIPVIRADINKINVVLTNLVSNALRYVKEKGHIKIYAKKAGSFVQISVQDDGIGIPPMYKTKIFQKFMQIDGRESGSTGLGLSICKEIVNAHGGAIWVESKNYKGSTFTFTIPIAR